MTREFKYFNFHVTTVTEGGSYPVFPNTCELLIINQGGDPCTVNGILLKGFPPGFPDLVGSSVAIDCNEDERYDDDVIEVAFAGTGTAPSVQIVQRFYKNKNR
jgi:hypothetical protein